ncbi:MAG: phosphoribosylanthranilate isomerase [Sedimentisphaeraceae bacterium JB056]
MNVPQVKICGITSSSQAIECAKLGADAIGMVFYDKSPRNISAIVAGRIAESINGLAIPVAVTVDMPIDELLCTAMITGISTFQLHGNEDAEYINRLRKAGLRSIKHVNASGERLVELADGFSDCYALLVECGKGELPGGNGAKWNWSQSSSISGKHPFILAGGLNCENVSEAIISSQADAVDVSSALEKEPGIKDMGLVKEFIEQSKNTNLKREVKRIFK